MSGAWSKGTNKAVSSAPPPGGMQASGSNNSGGRGGGRYNSNNNSGGGRGNANRRRRDGGGNNSNNYDGSNRSGGRGGRGRGGRNNNNNQNNQNNRRNNQSGGRGRGGRGNNNNQNDERITIKDVQLLNDTGMGTTMAQQKVIRISAREFVRQRLQYVEPCKDFEPHAACHWTDPERIPIIQALCSKVMELGDVSKSNSKNNNAKHDTAPALEDCKPLEVNEEKRWKSKAMTRKSSLIDDTPEPPETTEEIVGKALLILNKISWTTLDRLTVQFLETTNLEENAEVRKTIIDLLVHKAQIEPHFGPMYAQLCTIISRDLKIFKKELLEQCQHEFDVDTAHKIEAATKDITDPEEINYHSTLIRKAYIGHMKFLGELYLRNVVKLSVMMYCLDELLKDEEHEESLECFAHLMTTMGEKLDGHAAQNNKAFDWQKVKDLRQSTKISNRIKFLLQDLLELRERGWVKRREVETAKTIADIHKEIAQEEQAKNSGRRSSNHASLRRSSSLANAVVTQHQEIDNDGFVSINRGSFKKVTSKGNLNAGAAAGNFPKPVQQSSLRRAISQPANMSNYGSSSPTKPTNKFALPEGAPSAPILEQKESGKAVLPAADCVKKIQNILKEFFIGGDLDDAVLSVDELVQVGQDGSLDRGAKVIEGATLLVMEMKAQDVEKMLAVMTKSFEEGKIEHEAIPIGLADPLEFLSDIEIDAPLARNHLAAIVGKCIEMQVLTLSFFKEAPEYFRTDGKPAAFAVKVLKQVGGSATDEDYQVIESLMTEDDKKSFASGKAMFEA